MYNEKKISIVMPAYNEEGNIKRAIKDFFCTGIVDEIVVIDNNSIDKTFEIASRTRAKVYKERKQGYGWAIRRGMKEATGDIIVTVEPDATFQAKDLFKFLAYIDEFDVVFGTRTNKSIIRRGAKMNWFLRYGNIAVAKLLEYLHFENTSLTDVGCTFKMIRKESYMYIRKHFTVGDNSFSPDFMIECGKAGLHCVEIPIAYKRRVGTSTITDTHYKGFKLGLKMIWLIVRRF